MNITVHYHEYIIINYYDTICNVQILIFHDIINTVECVHQNMQSNTIIKHLTIMIAQVENHNGPEENFIQMPRASLSVLALKRHRQLL